MDIFDLVNSFTVFLPILMRENKSSIEDASFMKVYSALSSLELNLPQHVETIDAYEKLISTFTLGSEKSFTFD